MWDYLTQDVLQMEEIQYCSSKCGITFYLDISRAWHMLCILLDSIVPISYISYITHSFNYFNSEATCVTGMNSVNVFDNFDNVSETILTKY